MQLGPNFNKLLTYAKHLLQPKPNFNKLLLTFAKDGNIKNVVTVLSATGKIHTPDGEPENVNNIINALLAAGADIETKDYLLAAATDIDTDYLDYNGWTPLLLASFYGQTAIVNALLLRGPDIEAKGIPDKKARSSYTWKTVPHTLTPNSGTSLTSINYLYGQIASSVSDHGWTALMLASRNGQTATVNALLQAGADIEAKNNGGQTALIIASLYGQTATVNALLQAGADIEAKDSDNCTAVMLASLYGQTTTVNALLQAKADIEAKDHDQRTALILASYNGQVATVNALLQAGAKGEAKNHHGVTALIASQLKPRPSPSGGLVIGELIYAGVSYDDEERAWLIGRSQQLQALIIDYEDLRNLRPFSPDYISAAVYEAITQPHFPQVLAKLIADYAVPNAKDVGLSEQGRTLINSLKRYRATAMTPRINSTLSSSSSSNYSGQALPTGHQKPVLENDESLSNEELLFINNVPEFRDAEKEEEKDDRIRVCA